mgnify:CR=1 FL=1
MLLGSRNISSQMRALVQECVVTDPEKRPKHFELLRHSALNKANFDIRKKIQESIESFVTPQVTKLLEKHVIIEDDNPLG